MESSEKFLPEIRVLFRIEHSIFIHHHEPHLVKVSRIGVEMEKGRHVHDRVGLSKFSTDAITGLVRRCHDQDGGPRITVLAIGQSLGNLVSHGMNDLALANLDDFLQNYAGNTSGPCTPCPSSHPYPYGNPSSGEFCCPWPLDAGHCVAPAEESSSSAGECCIKPGANLQCQDVTRCGVNPMNYTACNLTHYEKTITLHDVVQIKGALMGMDVDPLTGVVNLTSFAKTPWLRLYVVWYTRFTKGYVEDGLLTGSLELPNNGGSSSSSSSIATTMVPIVDGVSLWIEGTTQRADYLNWTNCVNSYRTLTDDLRPTNLPRLITYGGAYIEHSKIGIMEPVPFWSIFNQSLELYEETQLDGFFIFAGSSIAKLNSTMMMQWNLEQHLNEWYQANLGTACGIIAPPFAGVRVSVMTIGGQHSQLVTSKYAKDDGSFCFDGWAGRTNKLAAAAAVKGRWMYEISSCNEHECRATQVELKRGEIVSFVLQ